MGVVPVCLGVSVNFGFVSNLQLMGAAYREYDGSAFLRNTEPLV